MARTLTLPLQRRGGTLVTVEQGSDAEVAQSVGLLLATRPGERRSVPTYGLPDPLFGARVDVSTITDTIAEWEDRADHVTIAQAVAALETGDPSGGAARTVAVGFTTSAATGTA